MSAQIQTTVPQMESNPLQRALDNYLVMEMQCEVAKREAAEVRAENAKLVAEIGMLRERLEDTEADRRKWEAACSTLLGRLLAINDTIGGAVKQAARDGLVARDEPGEADAVTAAGTQCAGTGEDIKAAPETEPPPSPPQRILAAVPGNQFLR